MPSELSSKELAALKANAQALAPAFHVGKSAVTDGVVKELTAHLEREPLVKVKMLRSALDAGDKRALAEDLAARAGAVLVEVRGLTAVFYRMPKRRGGAAAKR